MENTAAIALSRQTVLWRNMDVIANNLANMNTTGYKTERLMFAAHLVKSRGGARLTGERHAYVRDIASVRDTREGAIAKTGSPLDLAIRGKGFFVVETDEGERYTRNGRFQLDSKGQLVNQQGHPVLSQGGQPIFFSPADNDIDIAADGTISTENGEIGRLWVVEFENEQALTQIEAGLFKTSADPEDVDEPKIIQGALEGSNVQPIIEMTRMISVQRSYNSVSKIIDTEDKRIKQMMRTLSGQDGG